MGKPRDKYVDFLIEQFTPLGAITDKSMFGGYCLYCDGYVFGLVANSELYLKADALTVRDFESRGLKAFQPFDDQEMKMSYYQAPAEIYEDPDAMRKWVGGAVECGKRNYKPKKKSKRPA